MNEINFLVEQALEGGFTERALDASIFTQAESAEEPHTRVQNEVIAA